MIAIKTRIEFNYVVFVNLRLAFGNNMCSCLLNKSSAFDSCVFDADRISLIRIVFLFFLQNVHFKSFLTDGFSMKHPAHNRLGVRCIEIDVGNVSNEVK